MKTRFSLSIVSMLAVGAFALPAFAEEHEHEHEDLIVGRTSGGELMIEFAHFDEEHMLGSVSGAINGWLGDDPGFSHLEADEPGEDFYMLEAGAEIWFEVVSFDTAFQAWGPGLTGPYATAGDQVLLGDEELHEHLDWHINTDDLGYSLLDGPWEASFKLIDMGTTAYDDSPTYTLTFVPEPGTLGALLVAAIVLLKGSRA
jgi:hypothetical protein